MKHGDRITAELTGLSLDGDGLGTVDGRTIAVPRAFPGERVVARVEHVSRQHPRAAATLLEVLEPHPARAASPCPDDVTNGGRCTGCALGTLGIAAQREAKRAMLRDGFGLEVASVEGGEAWGYRRSSKRVAFHHGPRVALGSYVRGSHRAADMRHCRVDHPRIAEAARSIADAATEAGVTPFDERSGEGLLKAVWLKTDGARVLATLVVLRDDPRLEALAARAAAVDAVAVAIARADGNDLRGTALRMLRGPSTLETTLEGEPLSVGPLGFLQPNPEVAALAYRELVTDAEGRPRRGRLALDLYAGSGVTTRMLRRGFDEVRPCESFEESARALGVPATTAERFLAELLAAPERPAPELVVANPPRAGLGAAVVTALAALGAPSLAIMSCHPGSLARDLEALRAEGRYRLVDLRAYDTLPQTPHVELVARLERA